jgi:hypothetical protein
MKTIAHLPPTDTRMIDLTRSLKLPHGSLSPNTNPEPKWRTEARQDAEECSSHALYLFLGFIVLMAAIITHYLNA